jgi:hypothetical protein
MKKMNAIIISCAAGMLCVAVLPLALGMVHREGVRGDCRAIYLRGLSAMLDCTGAEYFAYNLGWSAHKIEYDLRPLDIRFVDDLESRLIRAEAETIEPEISRWGYEYESVSSGGGRYRFYVPSSELSEFGKSLRAYKAKLQAKRANGGEGYVLKAVNMNKLLEWLASMAEMKYFHNPALDDSFYDVTGSITDVVAPMSEINEIAKAFDLETNVKDDTLFAWSPVLNAEFMARAEKQLAEQAGAGQPATTPESKPESKEKPQPESKPAPR